MDKKITPLSFYRISAPTDRPEFDVTTRTPESLLRIISQLALFAKTVGAIGLQTPGTVWDGGEYALVVHRCGAALLPADGEKVSAVTTQNGLGTALSLFERQIFEGFVGKHGFDEILIEQEVFLRFLDARIQGVFLPDQIPDEFEAVVWWLKGSGDDAVVMSLTDFDTDDLSRLLATRLFRTDWPSPSQVDQEAAQQTQALMQQLTQKA